MNESTARAERFGLSSPTSSSPSTPAPSYLWEVPNKPVSVRMNLDMVDRLEREVVESFRSLSSRGSEIGGLLLGNVHNGNPARVTVEAYELVPCDYVRGPLFQLAEADTERFERAIEQRNAAGGLRVLGFFRSHTRKGLGLDSEDLAFFMGRFREPHQIALLIRPYASKPSTAGLFIWENGAVKGEASYLEFPFRRSEMERTPQAESKIPPEKPLPTAEASNPAPEPAAAKSAPRGQIVPIASRREATPATPERPSPKTELATEAPAPPRFSERAPVSEPPAAKFEPASPVASKLKTPAPEPEREREELAELVLPRLERPKRSNKMVWISAGAAAGLLLLSGALMYPGFSHKSKHVAAIPGQQAAALSLRVERSAGELLLSWNRDSDAIKNAAHGTLAITDGEQHENVNLDLGQLKNGSIVYSPTGNDVSFQLSIVGQNSAQTSSESVRILKTRPSPLADNTPAPTQKTPPPAPAPRTEPAPTTNAAAPVVTAPASSPNTEPTQVADNRKPSTVREFHAESLSQRLRPAKATDLPEAPGLTASAPAVPVALPGFGATPGIPAPAIPRPATSGSTVKAGGQLQQAQLISSKAPDYPLVAKQAHVQGVVVVSATVGVDGKVKSASAVSGPPLLQKAAVDAVRQWTYKPTTLNGAPVESETRVEVRFTGAR